MKANSVVELIGKTPSVKLSKLFPEMELWMKLEKSNPGGSIKDRIALAMIEDAETKGLLNSGIPIVEPTSGNTGIGLAMISAVKGYELILVMPESMSIERRKQMQAYGANIVLTDKKDGMKGAINKAYQIKEEKKAWMPMQFENMSNPATHYKNTAQEIIADFPDGLDYVITGVGTGGHISGIAKALKEKWPDIKIIAVEPKDSPILSGGAPSPHKIQGIGAGFKPDTLDLNMIDDVLTVQNDQAFEYARLLAKQEGLLCGISTGASAAAIANMKDQLKAKRVLTFNYDTGERYLSVENLFNV
jgi:cysteine synthase A